MYSQKPHFVYGFHGTDKEIAYKILNQQEEFVPSQNDYDWLGNGIYFWENSLERAKQYASEAMKRKNSKIIEPFALGAILDLGNCLDLLDQKYLDLLSISYQSLSQDMGDHLPKNTTFGPKDFDFRKRQLDCAVIRYTHAMVQQKTGSCFDTVRAVFWEGEELYSGAGFRKKNHIQIAVLNPKCIKGVFLPRD